MFTEGLHGDDAGFPFPTSHRLFPDALRSTGSCYGFWKPDLEATVMAKACFPGITWVLSFPKGGESLPISDWIFWGHLYDSKAY